ncbi:DUF3052 domain-containing protein [Cohnella sp. CFH 77786]|uniref:hypothetical protein n=1 Tax=Cohnella sp. CFH 77786 TaxID=2662265 RepID=UPI001C60A28D|nr:hypothetical protein [Cohnella sp. CFH 77786]MBW5449459.1 DUF3052 domain-containing protein [Cohnella sp. CFH 77786]
MAGYSTKSLAAKLGIKDNFSIYVENAPINYLTDLGELPIGVEIFGELEEKFDFMHIFSTDFDLLAVRLPRLIPYLSSEGMLWISWPKGSSKVETSLNGNLVRHLGQSNGLVDVKVCAVDDFWSGHKFVYRKEVRKTKT